MKIIIIGNEGYIGPILSKRIKKYYNNSLLAGFDIGYFAHLNNSDELPERYLDVQYRGDVRDFPMDILTDFDAVVYLAAISNDPMGNQFEDVTYEVNQKSAIRVAEYCKKNGIKNFIYASSCSVYGFADDKPRVESSELNPLTAYAKSKVNTERSLKNLASNNFRVTALRFATACGFSPRLRLDLVLNDFVASAITTKKIKILSDGTPWRPLIHVKDMARAIHWAIQRGDKDDHNFLVLNAGSNIWNYTIFNLAENVSKIIKNTEIEINENAEPDKRSYQVDFSKFEMLAPNYKPKMSLEETIIDLFRGLKEIEGLSQDFRSSDFIRLNILKKHIRSHKINKNLFWIS